MSQDSRDNHNPFASPARYGGDKDADEASGIESTGDENLRYDDEFDDEFDYDPDDVLAEDEERNAGARWQDPGPLEMPLSATRGAGTPEAGMPEAGTPEAGTPEAGTPEAGTPEAGMPDAGMPDAGMPEAGTPDNGQASSEPETHDEFALWPEADMQPDSASPEPPTGGEYHDHRDQPQDTESSNWGAWPLGLIGMAVVALVLLAVGGFGVIQERSALQEKVRELQAQLAVGVSPEQLAMEREAQRELVERSDALARELRDLRLENRQLADTVTGLEQQLQAQQEAREQAATAAAKQASNRESSTTPPAPQADTGRWFVNFGSYSKRELAQNWAKRLQPGSGKVIVSATDSGELYRVRVVGLPDKASAERVARTLQQAYDLPRLWVGEQ